MPADSGRTESPVALQGADNGGPGKRPGDAEITQLGTFYTIYGAAAPLAPPSEDEAPRTRRYTAVYSAKGYTAARMQTVVY
jgi:hypothetical protein